MRFYDKLILAKRTYVCFFGKEKNMINSKISTNSNKQPADWGFFFLSGLTGNSPNNFYKIQVEKTKNTCKTCLNMDNKIFLIKEAVIGKNFPPFHSNCACRAIDKNNNPVILWSQKFVSSMEQSYGFTKKESEIILHAYTLLMDEINGIDMTRQEKIHYIFSNLAALCKSYSSKDIKWWAIANVPSTEQVMGHLVELGMEIGEINLLYEAINRQHSSTDKNIKKDFAHELIQYALFANYSFIHNILDIALGDMNSLGSYKGDVFSSYMDIKDMNSDIDGINVYNRMLSNNKGFIETIVEYNTNVNNGKINRVDEFLKFYGNGDSQKGLQYIKNDLMNVDRGAHFISGTYKFGILGFIFETLIDIEFEKYAHISKNFLHNDFLEEFFKKNKNANKTFNEDETYVNSKENIKNKESITNVMKKFINYLEKGMSK